VAEFSKGCFSETIGETASLICANHRIAFDTGLFKVGPSTRTLIGCEDSNLTKLGISQTKLAPKISFRHKDALICKFNREKMQLS